jgi:hypothetical protein
MLTVNFVMTRLRGDAKSDHGFHGLTVTKYNSEMKRTTNNETFLL